MNWSIRLYLEPGVLGIGMTLLLKSDLTGPEVPPEQAVEVVRGEGEGPVLLVLPHVHLHSDGVAVLVDRQAGELGPQSVPGDSQHPDQGAATSAVLGQKSGQKSPIKGGQLT